MGGVRFHKKAVTQTIMLFYCCCCLARCVVNAILEFLSLVWRERAHSLRSKEQKRSPTTAIDQQKASSGEEEKNASPHQHAKTTSRMQQPPPHTGGKNKKSFALFIAHTHDDGGGGRFCSFVSLRCHFYRFNYGTLLASGIRLPSALRCVHVCKGRRRQLLLGHRTSSPGSCECSCE